MIKSSEAARRAPEKGRRQDSDSEVVLQLSDLHKAFRGHLGIGRTVAVERLDLQVEGGEIFGLLGPNGAGKTTTMKMILGLLRPDRGTVRMFGLPPTDPRARLRIGYLPENPYFYDYLTAEEFLDFYGRLRGIPAERRRSIVGQALQRVGLQGRERTQLRKFSKGMIQRLGLAQSIQHGPDLVILDEPMSGLDPIGRRDVRDLILAQKAAGRTVFFSSHILQDAEMICDRVAILRHGRVVSVGRLQEMVSGTVRWFEVAIRDAAAHDLPGEVLSGSAGEFLMRVPDVQALTRLLTEAERVGGQVVSVWPRQDSLEDLFMREIGVQAEGK